MDHRSIIDEYRAWCAAHLHPGRGETCVRALEDVWAAELKRGDPAGLVANLRRGDLDQANIAGVVARRGPGTPLGQRDERRYGEPRAVELALRHFVACSNLRRQRPQGRPVSAEELAFFDDDGAAASAAAAPAGGAPASPRGPGAFRDAFEEAQYVLEEAVAEHVHARPTPPAELALSLGDAAALAATLRGARLAPGRARLREVLAKYSCTAQTLASGMSLEDFCASRVEGGRFALAGRAGQRHRPLVVARTAFAGFPAPRDAAGAALVDGAVLELVQASAGLCVADCVAFVDRLLQGFDDGGGPRSALARRWVRDRGPPVDWRALGAPPAERVRRHAKLACDPGDPSAAARVGLRQGVWGDEGFAHENSLGPPREAAAADHDDAGGFPPTPYDVLQRHVEEAVAERLEAERHARLPLHLLTRALASADALESAGGEQRAALAREFRARGAARLADLTSGARAASTVPRERETHAVPRRRGPRGLPCEPPGPLRGRRRAERDFGRRLYAAGVAPRRRGARRRRAGAAPGAGPRAHRRAVRRCRVAGRAGRVAECLRAELRPLRRGAARRRAGPGGAAGAVRLRGAAGGDRAGGCKRLRGDPGADGPARRGRARVAVEARPRPGRAGGPRAPRVDGRLPRP